LAQAFNEKEAHGALVGEVTPDSPAKKCGLQRGDIIVDVNGKPVAGANDLRMTISMMAPDTPVTLRVLRNGVMLEIPVTLGTLPANEAAVTPENSGSNASALSGVTVKNLDAETAHDLGLPPAAQGVVITNVDPASDAAEAGLQKGDVVQEVNHQSVKNVSQFERALAGSKEAPLLLVNRNGNTLYVVA
jgi:serine protease Do